MEVLYLAEILLIVAICYYICRYFVELIPISGDLKTRAVFITGCDTGFGRLLAIKCAKAGIPVYAACLTKQGADSISKEACVQSLLLDVSKDNSVLEAKQYVETDLQKDPKKQLWALVNNAGVFSIYGPDAWCTIQQYHSSIEINLLGIIRCTQAFVPLLKQSKGRIISVSSVSGRLATPYTAPYCVAKFGVEAYMDCVRLELREFGVKCSILEPGIFKTALIDGNHMHERANQIWKVLPDHVRKEYGENFKDRFIALWNRFMDTNSSTQLHYVVDNYYHAITSRFPRARYRCGYDALLLYVPAAFLPTWLCDFLLIAVTNRDAPRAAVLDKKSK